MGRRLLLLGVLALGLACGRPWKVPPHPAVDAIDGQRLADTSPYLIPAAGRVTYFLCRWPDDAEIPVTMPDDASEAERNDIRRVLRAWQRAGLGVRFGPPEPGRGFEFRYVRASQRMAPRAASAQADCRLQGGPGDWNGAVLPAEIEFASIHLTRSGLNAMGQEKPWTRAERVGALLHEVGHALGYQGHPARGKTVMRADTERVRKAGVALRAGEPFRAPTLEALYALPTGFVLGRVPLDPEVTRDVDQMLELASDAELEGPIVRVGDRAAAIVWRSIGGRTISLRIRNLWAALHRPADLRVTRSPAADRLLGKRVED